MAIVDEEEDKHQLQQPDGIGTSQSSPQSVLTLLTEIMIEILWRLPIDSLLRCKSVCKSWRSLISDPNFIKSHLTLSTNSSNYAHHRIIFSNMRRMSLKTCYLNDALYDNSVNALQLDYPFTRPRKSVRIVGSCNGLLCVSNQDDTLFIWNPSTRKLNRLPSDPYKPRFTTVHYGFGYEESTDDYKVVEIGVKYYERFKYNTFVKIYSLRNGNWKDIGAFPYGMPLDYSAKFLNGALHWAANGDLSRGVNDYNFFVANNAIRVSFDWNIFSFDLTTETYGEVLQPVYDVSVTRKHLTLGSLREWLCVLCNYSGSRADLWVMKVYGVKDSWTKLVSIPYLTAPEGFQFSVPLCISNDGKILLEFGWKLIVYDSKNGSFSEFQNIYKCGEASTFVESLVSPMPAATLGDRI